jgi:hypothetical protein
MARTKGAGSRKALKSKPKLQPKITKKAKRIKHATPAEWATFPMAEEDKHFKRVANLGDVLTPGKKWRCIMMEEFDKCKMYAKKSSFVDHMRDMHHLNVLECPRSRPLLPGNERKERLEEVKALQDKRVQGSWIMRMWRAKMQKCTKLIQGCLVNADLCPKGTNKTDWVLEKVKKKYDQWRSSEEFFCFTAYFGQKHFRILKGEAS